MSEPTGNPRVQFRAAPDLHEKVRARKQLEEADGEVVRRDIQRYYAVIDAELQRLRLTAEEAGLICDALNGYASLAEDPDIARRSWWINVEDHISLNDADKKWGVSDPAVLVAKLRALSPGASAAVLDAVERWWLRDGPEGETIPESLQAVGLIRQVPDSVAWVDELEAMDGEDWKL